MKSKLKDANKLITHAAAIRACKTFEEFRDLQAGFVEDLAKTYAKEAVFESAVNVFIQEYVEKEEAGEI